MAASIVSARSNGKTFVGVAVRSPFAHIKQALQELKTAGVKQLMNDVGDFWHRVILPFHFLKSNQSDYVIAPRTTAYWIGRQRADGGFGIGTKRRYGIGKGKSVANVFSGQTERRMTYIYNVTSTSKSATVHMDVPTYFDHPDNPFGSQPDKVAETLQVNQRDVSLMNQFVFDRLTQIGTALKRAA